MTETTWSAISARLGRNDLPYALGKAVLMDHTITDPAEIAKGIADAWVAAEWPSQCIEESLWEMMFEMTGFIDDDGIKDPETAIPENLVLYRGAVESRKRGMSWTTDLARASWFAHRFDLGGKSIGQQGNVYRLSITPGFILANFNDRNEHEWVVATSELEDEEFVLITA